MLKGECRDLQELRLIFLNDNVHVRDPDREGDLLKTDVVWAGLFSNLRGESVSVEKMIQNSPHFFELKILYKENGE